MPAVPSAPPASDHKGVPAYPVGMRGALFSQPPAEINVHATLCLVWN